MKIVTKYYIQMFLLMLCAGLLWQTASAQVAMPADEKATIAEFEKRAKEYARLREDIEDRLPKLSKEATPEEIERHKTTFQAAVQSARKDAKHGEIFTPAASKIIRRIIKTQYKGKELAELRKIALEVNTKEVPLRINYPYPDSTEQVEMPPALLLELPQLPKQLRYRFVGRNLILVDRENGLIVDYMPKAVP